MCYMVVVRCSDTLWFVRSDTDAVITAALALKMNDQGCGSVFGCWCHRVRNDTHAVISQQPRLPR
jgi:hypothetical protein